MSLRWSLQARMAQAAALRPLLEGGELRLYEDLAQPPLAAVPLEVDALGGVLHVTGSASARRGGRVRAFRCVTRGGQALVEGTAGPVPEGRALREQGMPDLAVARAVLEPGDEVQLMGVAIGRAK